MNESVTERLDIIEKAIRELAQSQRVYQEESLNNFVLIDEILEAHSDCLDILVEESPDLEMIYPEDESKTATVLSLVVDNTKDKE